MATDYTIAIGPYTAANPTYELVFYDSWTIDKNLDDGCTFSFSVPGYVPEAQAINELDTDVWVYRSGLLKQRFRIIDVDQTWGPSGEDEIKVQAVCYRRLLGSRYLQTNLQFNQVSQGDIIWQLIQHTQAQTNGNLGITAGSLGPTVLRDRSYEAGQNILDIIVDLTNVENGPTWDIDENLQLIVSRSDLYPLNPTPVVLGATASSLSRPSGAAKFANVAVVSGNQQQTTLVTAQSPTLAADTRGRWERRASYPSVVLQTTLANQATGLLTEYQAPSTIWQVDVVPDRYFGDANYALGEFVRLVQPASTAAPVGNPAVEIIGQVLSIRVDQDADGDTKISMRVAELGDAISVVGAASDVTGGGYRVVTWTGSGNLTVRGSLNVEYLVVAGGGGGGGAGSSSPYLGGGGGGAGGLLTNFGSPISISGTKTIVVGAGGTAGPYGTGLAGTDGSNSSFDSFIAVGGGRGANPSTVVANRNGQPGGSGGGGASSSTAAGTGGAGTIGQGNNGGSGTVGSPGVGGGGGGAGTAGGSPTAGAGVTSTITGTLLTYAVGGTGGTTSAGTAGTDGRGNGGGGGGGINNAGADGGDGIVIVRWLA